MIFQYKQSKIHVERVYNATWVTNWMWGYLIKVIIKRWKGCRTYRINIEIKIKTNAFAFHSNSYGIFMHAAVTTRWCPNNKLIKIPQSSNILSSTIDLSWNFHVLFIGKRGNSTLYAADEVFNSVLIFLAWMRMDLIGFLWNHKATGHGGQAIGDTGRHLDPVTYGRKIRNYCCNYKDLAENEFHFTK